ncbi:Phosphoenolpyruvate carboxykinase [GTP] [compost metagenome]
MEDLNLDGLDIPAADLDELFAVDAAAWQTEADLTEEFYDTFGDKVPAALRAELASLRYRLAKA